MSYTMDYKDKYNAFRDTLCYLSSSIKYYKHQAQLLDPITQALQRDNFLFQAEQASILFQQQKALAVSFRIYIELEKEDC